MATGRTLLGGSVSRIALSVLCIRYLTFATTPLTTTAANVMEGSIRRCPPTKYSLIFVLKLPAVLPPPLDISKLILPPCSDWLMPPVDICNNNSRSILCQFVRTCTGEYEVGGSRYMRESSGEMVAGVQVVVEIMARKYNGVEPAFSYPPGGSPAFAASNATIIRVTKSPSTSSDPLRATGILGYTRAVDCLRSYSSRTRKRWNGDFGVAAGGDFRREACTRTILVTVFFAIRTIPKLLVKVRKYSVAPRLVVVASDMYNNRKAIEEDVIAAPNVLARLTEKYSCTKNVLQPHIVSPEAEDISKVTNIMHLEVSKDGEIYDFSRGLAEMAYKHQTLESKPTLQAAEGHVRRVDDQTPYGVYARQTFDSVLGGILRMIAILDSVGRQCVDSKVYLVFKS
ncbi:hypothetical protein EDD18DRAFT_1115635 [Armillaria luteobubalina]|uniref:Uncharacterized protein n=1 Tax=Armillaria luteobubalina TaxID=153913 RepID=A0AA39P2C4_9AGAR|nr:hypothetical protein EDD18DRAFT_1115635 [Armillaria luteobubalina]